MGLMGDKMSKPITEDLFKFSGRRNRKSYFLYFVAVMVVLAIIWGIAAAVASPVLMGVAAIISLGMTISSLAVGAQRCRDFGWTGWAILIQLIPAVGFIFACAMLFVPGNVGQNRYGPDPIPGA